MGTAKSDTLSIKALTKLYNSKLGIISQDIYWEMGFPQEFLTQCLEERVIPFVYWTPSIKTDIAPMRLSGISDSSWDDYLLDWVRACKSYEYPLFICFGPFDSKSGERDSFREAYQLTGKIVAYADKNNKKLNQLTIKELKKFNKDINLNAKKTFSVDESLKNKKSFGGTSPQSVKQTIKYAIKKYL